MQHNITLFNRIFNPVTKSYSYKRTYLQNAHWQAGHKVTTNKGHNTSSSQQEEIKVYIPFQQAYSYCPPKEMERIDDKSLYYTFNPGDKIVRGHVDFELTETNQKLLMQTYDHLITIASIKIRDFGSLSLQHAEIGGT